MTRRTPDDTQPSLAALGGRVCPKCRHRAADEKPTAIEKCPNDGYALIEAATLAEADGDPFLGTTIADRFVVIGKLGAGSMGTVYRARQEAMGRDVAIKILRSDRAFDAQAKARFQREARAMSLLASPHTVTVFDFGEVQCDGDLGGGQSLYLAMEILEGESLGQRLKRLRRLKIDDAVRIARHALLSLAEAHDKGIIHRDLKPDNLFLAKSASGDEEICKVLDFGIAKVVTEGASSVDALETQAGTVFGTPRYMSPEQAQGKPLDARSDLYSLGVLLYQMLAGRAPFVDDDAVVVMARHIKSMPTAPIDAAPDAGIGEALSNLVMRALAKDPNDRFANAKDFIQELDRAVGAPRRLSSRPEIPVSTASATGEMAALSRDDLDSRRIPTDAPGPVRSRALWLVAATLIAVGLVAFFEFGLMRTGGAPVTGTRANAAATALAAPPVAAADSAAPTVAPPAESASAPASADASASAAPTSVPAASGVSRPPASKKPGSIRKPYTKFE